MDGFDRLLYAGSDRLPPELAGQRPPCPWRKPIGLICWGLALITITLDLLGLDIILPAVGTVLLWLGLRPLRRENGAFRFAYACATVYAVLRLAGVLLQATPMDGCLAELIGREWVTATGSVPLYHVLRTVLVQTVLVLAVGGLWQGLKGVSIRAGQEPRTAAAGGLAILEALLILLALLGLEGWLLVGPVMLVWICLVVGLYKLSKSLDRVGYALRPAPMPVSSGLALGLWLGLHLLGIGVLPLLFSRLPVNSQTPAHAPGGDAPLRAELLELGFPEDILDDLGDRELSRFQGAYGLKKEGYHDGEGAHLDGMPSVVTIEVPVRDERYGSHTVCLAYLRWDSGESSGGFMEGIQVVPDLQGVTVRTTCPDAVLKWQDSAGISYIMPLDFRSDTDDAGTSCYFADFSLPEDVSGPVEGYLFWEAMPSLPETVSIYNYHVTIAHRRSAWQYPYTLPSDVLATGSHGPGWRTYQWAFEGQLAPEGKYDPGKY